MPISNSIPHKLQSDDDFPALGRRGHPDEDSHDEGSHDEGSHNEDSLGNGSRRADLPTQWEAPTPPTLFDGRPRGVIDLMDEIRDWCASSGFGIATLRSERRVGGFIKYTIECDRALVVRPSKAFGLRKTSTRRNCPCPFRIVVQRKTGDGDLGQGFTGARRRRRRRTTTTTTAAATPPAAAA